MAFKLFLTGQSLHTSLGFGLAQHAKALANPTPDQLKLPPKVTLPIELLDSDAPANIPYHLAHGKPLIASERRYFDILEGVISEALDLAGLTTDQRQKTALFLGTSSSDVCLIEQKFLTTLEKNPDAEPMDMFASMDNLGSHLRSKFKLSAHGMSINTACTASANAMLYAAATLKTGRIEHALIVGAEILNITTAYGFQGLELLTKTAMRPFDSRRDGLVLGEAVSAVILSAKRPAEPCMQFLGGASLSDNYGMSVANPDGSSIARVIHQALKQADLKPEQIDVIKAHATASLLNDEGECAGLTQVFENMPIVTALKPYIGHTFGASGLTELLILNACLNEGFLPGTPGISVQACDKLGITLNQSAKQMNNPNILLNQFGFGGNNTSLVVRHG